MLLFHEIIQIDRSIAPEPNSLIILLFAMIEKQCIKIRLHSFKNYLLCFRVELSTLMISFRSIRDTILK